MRASTSMVSATEFRNWFDVSCACMVPHPLSRLRAVSSPVQRDRMRHPPRLFENLFARNWVPLVSSFPATAAASSAAYSRGWTRFGRVQGSHLIVRISPIFRRRRSALWPLGRPGGDHASLRHNCTSRPRIHSAFPQGLDAGSARRRAASRAKSVRERNSCHCGCVKPCRVSTGARVMQGSWRPDRRARADENSKSSGRPTIFARLGFNST